MSPIRQSVIAGAGLLIGLLSTTAQAYGPRDSMSYQHPTVMPTAADCAAKASNDNKGSSRTTRHPRQGRQLNLCPTSRKSGKATLRVKTTGPRSRVVTRDKSRRGTRLARR